LPMRSIVALYPTLAQAEKAERALQLAGVPANDISLSAQVAAFGEAREAAKPARPKRAEPHEQSYFEWLVGARIAEGRVLRYRDLLDGGAGLVCVRIPEALADSARAVLRSHSPLDLDAAAQEAIDAAFAGTKPGSANAALLDEYVIGE
jgi:hypothetical protein